MNDRSIGFIRELTVVNYRQTYVLIIRQLKKHENLYFVYIRNAMIRWLHRCRLDIQCQIWISIYPEDGLNPNEKAL